MLLIFFLRSGPAWCASSELFPEVIDQQVPDDQPSCSVAEALDRQEPFVNPTLANHALSLLGRLFRYGTLSCQGGFVSLGNTARVQLLPIDKGHLALRTGCELVNVSRSRFAISQSNLGSECPYQAIGSARDNRRFPPPGQMVDVGGYCLHIHSMGEGSPTVVLESALGGSSLSWAR